MTSPDLPSEPLQELATRVNGFVYHGDRLNAVIDTVKEFRADAALARDLLGLVPLADVLAALDEYDHDWDSPGARDVCEFLAERFGADQPKETN